MASKGTIARSTMEKALEALRFLPRVSLTNTQNNPGARKKSIRGRGDHGGKTHGYGTKGAKAHQGFIHLGHGGTQKPIFRRVPKEPYYAGHHLKRQYPPLTLYNLQRLIDSGFIDASQPIDLTSVCNSKQYRMNPFHNHFGIHLTDEGIDLFKAKVNIEVQYAKEAVIAAVERNGGVITTTYYDLPCLYAALDTEAFFRKSIPIPRRRLPPEDALEYYSDPKFRGYLADPDKIADERLVLAQKYGYVLPDLSKDPDFQMLSMRKDPRQVFYGLEPGWVVNLKDKVVLKACEKWLTEFYAS